MSIFIISLLLFISQVLAIPPRVLQGCITLNTSVYCYGGYTSAFGGRFVNATSDIYTFRLSNVALYYTAPSIQWSLVNASSSNLEPRAAMAITALNTTHFIISGGDSNGNSLKNSTIIIDSKTNTSFALSAPPFSTYAGSLVAVNSSNSVWGYGGQWYNSSSTVPNSMLMLNLTTLAGAWTTFSNGVFAPSSSRYGHAAVVRNTMIYYFGGFLPSNSTSSLSQPVSFKTVDFYNTATDQWGSIKTAGLAPSPRKYHTATLIDNVSVLIYGGTGVDQPQSLPVLDYSYIFKLDDHTYHKIDLDSSIGAGPRIGHSAVLYQENVFILFGYDSSGNLKNDTHLLDVSIPDYPVWAGSYSFGAGDAYEYDDNHITKVIAGAIVGSVAFILVIIGGIIFARKKRLQRSAKPYQHCLSSSPQNQQAEIAPISSSHSPLHAHSNLESSGTTMAIDNRQPSGYPSDPAPPYSLYAPPTEISKANL